MFNLSGSEIVFLLLIALIVLGPEKLPEAVRKFGKTYGEFKKMSTGFQSELKTALDEPMREMRETADALKKAANFDFDAEPDGEPAADADAAPGNAPPIDATQSPQKTAPDVGKVADEATDEVPDEVTDQVVEDAAEPVVRGPGPNFASAAPRPRVVSEPAEETASE
jgi:sec-independent protein translocase protein TatB